MEVDSYLSGKKRRRRKKQRYLYAAAAFAGAYLLIVGIAWFFLGNPLFRVDRVTVQGARAVPTDEVVAIVQSAALRNYDFWKSLLGYRNMLTWPVSLSSAGLAFNPRLKKVTVSKDYFSHTITVHVTERQPFGAWCFMAAGGTAPGERCYLFDDAGFMFARTLDTQGNLIFVVHDHSQSGRGLAREVLPAEFAPNLISILDALKASGIGVSDITLKDLSLEEIDVATYEGPTLYFSLRFPANEDLPVLEELMKKPDFGKLEYVDFRVENRAYYK